MQKKLGILGGTFNPIHDAHIAIANNVLKALALDRVELIPCFQPPHRDQPTVSPQDRFAMVSLAVKNYPDLHANDIEIQQPRISYSIDTLTALQKKLPDTDFYYIVGADAFLHFDTWYEWKKIFSIAKIVVVSRYITTITTPTSVADFLKKEHLESQLHFLQIKPITISATEIRDAIHAGQKIIPGLNNNVLNYIREKKLYCDK